MFELLAPAGDLVKLRSALHFGADAVYFGGDFSLRAAARMSREDLAAGIGLCHAAGKKAYVTLNIFPKDRDFPALEEQIDDLAAFGADGVILSDPGLLRLCVQRAPGLPVHLSTQANTLNRFSAAFWADQGVRRIVLARELSLAEIAGIREGLDPSVQLEAFVHGAMCIGYSGRCLLSNYLHGRDANRGACVQACRWAYRLTEAEEGRELEVWEDERGSYFLNSRDLCMIGHLKELAAAGVESFKIEGRMKSEFYVGTVVNAYRRAADALIAGREVPEGLSEEVAKAGHRPFTTAWYLGPNGETEFPASAAPVTDYRFAALVLERRGDRVLVEQRNRFFEGDELEMISPSLAPGQKLRVQGLTDEEGNPVPDARWVQQRLLLPDGGLLQPLDMLRKKA